MLNEKIKKFYEKVKKGFKKVKGFYKKNKISTEQIKGLKDKVGEGTKAAKLTINRQVQLGFISLIVLISLIGFFVFFNTRQMNKNINQLKKKVIPAVGITDDIYKSLSSKIKQNYGTEAGLNFKDFDGYTDEEYFNDVRADIKSLRDYVQNDETLKKLNTLEDAIDEFEMLNQEYSEAVREKDQMLRTMTIEDIYRIEQKINLVNDLLAQYSWGKLDNTITITVEQAEANKRRIIVINIVGLLISFGLGFAVHKGIDKVTKNIKSETNQAAHKAELVNSSANKMKEIADDVEQQVTKTFRVMKSLMKGNEEVSKAVGEVSVAIEEIATGIGELSKQAQNISRLGKDTYQSFQKTDKKIESGSEVIYDTANTMKDLQKSVAKIGNISDRIIKITNQTNLLALNAAIEAARAGKHGQGFTVVAEEIKDLADESMHASKEVKEIVGEIEEVAEQAVEVMIEGNDETEQSIVAIFDEINTLSTEVTEKMENVINSAEDQAAASEEISALTEEISASGEEVSAQTDETLDSAEQVVDIMRDLTDSNSDLYFKIKEQVSSSEEQLELINEVVEVNKQLK